MFNNCLLLIFNDKYVAFHVSAMTQTIESAFNSIKGKLLEPNFISYIEDKILHKFVHETIKSNKLVCVDVEYLDYLDIIRFFYINHEGDEEIEFQVDCIVKLIHCQ